MHVTINLIEAYSDYYRVSGYLNKTQFFMMDISNTKFEIIRFKLQSTLHQPAHYDFIYACSMQAIKNKLVMIRKMTSNDSDKLKSSPSNSLVDEILHRGQNQTAVDSLVHLQNVG